MHANLKVILIVAIGVGACLLSVLLGQHFRAADRDNLRALARIEQIGTDIEQIRLLGRSFVQNADPEQWADLSRIVNDVRDDLGAAPSARGRWRAEVLALSRSLDSYQSILIQLYEPAVSLNTQKEALQEIGLTFMREVEEEIIAPFRREEGERLYSGESIDPFKARAKDAAYDLVALHTKQQLVLLELMLGLDVEAYTEAKQELSAELTRHEAQLRYMSVLMGNEPTLQAILVSLDQKIVRLMEHERDIIDCCTMVVELDEQLGDAGEALRADGEKLSSQITGDLLRSARLNRVVDWSLMLGIIAALGVLGALLARNIIQFVNDLRATHQQLEKNETILRATLESSNDGVLVVTDDQSVSHTNSRFQAIWSVPAEIIESGDDQALIRHVLPQIEDLEGFTDRINEVYQTSEPSDDSLSLKDGRLLERYSYPLILAGQEGGRVWLFRDVTDRERAEEAARERDRMLRTLVANLPGFVYRCKNDRDWTMEYLGGRFEEVTGYTPEDLIDDRRVTFNDLIMEEHRERLWKAWQEQLSKREPLEAEYTIEARDGTIKWVWEQGRGVFDDEGTLLSLEGFICDITDRKRAEADREKLEAQLRQSQKMEAIGQLAGGVAHDFNNILTAILGNVELSMDSVRTEFGPDHGVVGSMEQIEQAAQRASVLTRQLLTFSRRDVVQPQPLNLNDILAGLDKMLLRLVTEDIAIETFPEPELKTVQADAGQLEQVIVNLVVNAVHAMPDGGRLTMETQNVMFDEGYTSTHAEARPGPHVMLAVSDTGHGMDAATCERIFEPFFTTKPADKGTGLGLATVHGIVKQSGGHIIVYSEPGRGTTFKAYLPAIDAAPVGPTRAALPDVVPGGDETILLCEDDRPVCELIAQSLRIAGYTVMTASSGSEGIKVVQKHVGTIDLLITDVIMPDMNGRALSERLRALRPGLPLLFISGYTSNIIAHHGVLDEGVEFLEKPFTRHGLLKKIRAVINKSRADA